jgi:16S rRNA (cytosine967-C5)-methyltransferase
VHRTGVTNVRMLQADLLRPLPFRDGFSCVFVDAPCSGLGTLRRDPDLRWRRQPADLDALASDQRTMLEHAAGAVAPGGRLVYATCSSEPEENDAVVDAFLERHAEFRVVSSDRLHPALPLELVGDDHRLRTAPDRHGLEAFFGAAFERR